MPAHVEVGSVLEGVTWSSCGLYGSYTETIKVLRKEDEKE